MGDKASMAARTSSNEATRLSGAGFGVSRAITVPDYFVQLQRQGLLLYCAPEWPAIDIGLEKKSLQILTIHVDGGLGLSISYREGSNLG